MDNVQEQLYKAGYEMKQMEGYRQGKWVLLDFSDIIVHIFDKENRLFYDLERSGETEKKLICQKYKKWHRKITEKQKWVIRERLRKEVLSLVLL